MPSPVSPRRQKRIAVSVPRIVHGGEHSLFFALLKRDGLPIPTPEYRFHAERRWRFDYAWPIDSRWGMLALEVEGGAFTRGRHTRGVGFIKDMEKYSEAAAMGWRILRVTPSQLCTTETIQLIKRALNV